MMKLKRTEFFAYMCGDNDRVIGFSRHFSRLAAEKYYGNPRRFYKGSSHSDFYVTIYEGREKFETDLSGGYVIDYKTKTLTRKEIDEKTKNNKKA